MKRASAPAYDRFKTIVAVILGIILLLMLLRGCATTPAPSAPVATRPSATAAELLPTSAPVTETVLAPNPTESPTPTSVPPTTEATSTASAAADTATPIAAATETPTTVPADTTLTPVQNASCNTIAPSRLSVGQKARVAQRLNVRNNASINAAIVKVNPTNTQVEIIGGPTCEPVGGHAYLWWQVRLSDGTEGWSAESQLNSAGYFLEPLP